MMSHTFPRCVPPTNPSTGRDVHTDAITLECGCVVRVTVIKHADGERRELRIKQCRRLCVNALDAMTRYGAE